MFGWRLGINKNVSSKEDKWESIDLSLKTAALLEPASGVLQLWTPKAPSAAFSGAGKGYSGAANARKDTQVQQMQARRGMFLSIHITV